MTQNQVIEWMDKKVELFKETLKIRNFSVGSLELRGIDYSINEMQFGGDIQLFITLASVVGSPIKTEIRRDEYIALSFYYSGIRWFMLMQNPCDKEDQ